MCNECFFQFRKYWNRNQFLFEYSKWGLQNKSVNENKLMYFCWKYINMLNFLAVSLLLFCHLVLTGVFCPEMGGKGWVMIMFIHIWFDLLLLGLIMILNLIYKSTRMQLKANIYRWIVLIYFFFSMNEMLDLMIYWKQPVVLFCILQGLLMIVTFWYPNWLPDEDS